jgi:hypothetical protein
MGWRQAGPLGASLEHHDHTTALRHLVHHQHHLPAGRTEWQHDKSIRRRLELYPLSGGLTVTLLHQALPRVRGTAAETWVGPLNAACERYEITRSARRMAAFLGHIAHESSYLHAVEENMRYKDSDRLAKVYPSAFKTPVDAEPYVNKPEALANKVYANRIGTETRPAATAGSTGGAVSSSSRAETTTPRSPKTSMWPSSRIQIWWRLHGTRLCRQPGSGRSTDSTNWRTSRPIRRCRSASTARCRIFPSGRPSADMRRTCSAGPRSRTLFPRCRRSASAIEATA